MSLLATMDSFCGGDFAAEKAAFEAAMKKRIEEEGYKMADLMFDVYICQKRIYELIAESQGISVKKKGKR